MAKTTTSVKDGMRIQYDVSIPVRDGIVLKADVFLPTQPGRYPVIMSYGPYGKGLAFQDGYKTCWDLMSQNPPDVTEGSTNKYQNWEVVDPEKWVPHDYVCIRWTPGVRVVRQVSCNFGARRRPSTFWTALNGQACRTGLTAKWV